MLEKNIQQWLKLRQTVLVHYKELCTTKDTRSTTLQVFFQNLMDYISMGHLQMFAKLMEHHEMNLASSNSLNKNWLPNIQDTTDKILDFNDKYTEPKNLDTLSADLSRIGEILAHRMDWEDALIKGIAPRYIKDK